MFSRLDSQIIICKQHIVNSQSQGTQIEFILVGYILAVTYAHFESIIRDSIKERCAAGVDPEADPPASKFVRHAVDRVVRSIKISELSGVLGLFSDTYKQEFQEIMKSDSIAETYYHNLVSNRHAMAHSASANATMKDVEEWLPSGKAVIEAFRQALKLHTGPSYLK